jgi:hypothetical protein
LRSWAIRLLEDSTVSIGAAANRGAGNEQLGHGTFASHSLMLRHSRKGPQVPHP